MAGPGETLGPTSFGRLPRPCPRVYSFKGQASRWTRRGNPDLVNRCYPVTDTWRSGAGCKGVSHLLPPARRCSPWNRLLGGQDRPVASPPIREVPRGPSHVAIGAGERGWLAHLLPITVKPGHQAHLDDGGVQAQQEVVEDGEAGAAGAGGSVVRTGPGALAGERPASAPDVGAAKDRATGPPVTKPRWPDGAGGGRQLARHSMAN